MLLFACGALAESDFAGRTEEVYATIEKPSAALAALGVNPILALGLFGLFDFLGAPGLPRLGFLGHPAVFLTLILFGLAIKVGKSTKITKPIAQTADALGGLPLGVVAAGVAAFPLASAAVASLPQTHVAAAVGIDDLMIWAMWVSAMGSLAVLMLAFDVLIWLSPFPFVDAAFETVKLLTTLALVLLAVFAPTVAMVLSFILLLVAVLAVRWAIRAARFGLTMAYDATLGRLSPAMRLPKDPLMDEDVGPFEAFALDVPGQKRRAHGELSVKARTWVFQPTGIFGRGKEIRIGETATTRVFEGWVACQLTVDRSTFVLTGRYRHLAEEIAKATGGDYQKRAGIREALIGLKSIAAAPAER
ncbi:MAG: hypothetical protein HYV07_32460 [Deltaproteobacteria bacterium]|nr:hypothetical protein [Deltaproteobacteria bacterium]